MLTNVANISQTMSNQKKTFDDVYKILHRMVERKNFPKGFDLPKQGIPAKISNAKDWANLKGFIGEYLALEQLETMPGVTIDQVSWTITNEMKQIIAEHDLVDHGRKIAYQVKHKNPLFDAELIKREINNLKKYALVTENQGYRPVFVFFNDESRKIVDALKKDGYSSIILKSELV